MVGHSRIVTFQMAEVAVSKERCLRGSDFDESTWTTQESKSVFGRKMTRQQLIHGWGSDRFRSFTTGKSEELISEVDMRNVESAYLDI